MSDEAVRQWLRRAYPQREADEREATLLGERVREALDAFERAQTELMALVFSPAPSHFEIETQMQRTNTARQEFVYAQRERDLRLEQTLINIDAQYASIIAAMRALPQTAPIVTQERLDRELTICLTLANPTLPPPGPGAGDTVTARRSTVF
jgi:hypothetical protein